MAPAPISLSIMNGPISRPRSITTSEKIRNPDVEIRNNLEMQNKKRTSEDYQAYYASVRFWIFLRVSFGFRHSDLFQPSRHFRRKVGEDHIGAGAFDARQDFQSDALFVDPA